MSGIASGLSKKLVFLLLIILTVNSAAEPVMFFRKESDLLRPKPFETIRYTLAYSNGGDELATNVTVTDYLPSRTVLSANSAEVSNVLYAGTAIVEYWAFGSWRQSSYGDTNALCQTVEKVRWALDRAVRPGEAGRLVFRAVVK